MTRLIVGLGNPGESYAGTRHNVGFDVVDQLAQEGGAKLFQSARQLPGYSDQAPRGGNAFLWTRIESLDALLIKPQSFMNRSGQVVAPVAHFLWPPTESGPEDGDVRDSVGSETLPEQTVKRSYPDLMVVYDDLDLPPSRLRIRPHGGAGGHNGMRSIIEHLSTDLFPRLKVGIGREGTDAARHVLAPFSAHEQESMQVAFAESAEAILDWLQEGDLEGCMTRFHSRWNQ